MSDTTIRDNEEILFEIDVFNENSCMLSLREIVQKLHTEISPPDEENSTKMPNWMQRFRKADGNEEAGNVVSGNPKNDQHSCKLACFCLGLHSLFFCA